MQSTPSPTISTCQLPADNADGVMAVTPPAGCEVGTQHLDALGNALQVGDKLQHRFISGETAIITALFDDGSFIFESMGFIRVHYTSYFVKVAA